ncbi:MAG: flagellar hook-associated protein FlgK [Kiritimatiellia bacterium]|jgi:flagellar hook-associated protein FlgK
MINTSAGISNVFQQGISGLNSSSRSIAASANELVLSGTVERASTTTTDIVEPLVKMRMEQHIFNASASVIKVADEALGALIDTKA